MKKYFCLKVAIDDSGRIAQQFEKEGFAGVEGIYQIIGILEDIKAEQIKKIQVLAQVDTNNGV